MTHENIPPGSVIPVRGENDPALLETVTESVLQQMLAAVDPKKHGGAVMDGGQAGVEAIAHGNA